MPTCQNGSYVAKNVANLLMMPHGAYHHHHNLHTRLRSLLILHTRTMAVLSRSKLYELCTMILHLLRAMYYDTYNFILRLHYGYLPSTSQGFKQQKGTYCFNSSCLKKIVIKQFFSKIQLYLAHSNQVIKLGSITFKLSRIQKIAKIMLQTFQGLRNRKN